MKAVFSLVIASLKQKRIPMLAYSAGGFAALWLYVAIYPSLQSQSQSYTAILKSLSPAVLKAFGAYDIGLNNLEGLLAGKQFGLTWPLLLLFLAVSLAGSTLAGEIEQTTMGLWLAAPISRAKIYWSKFTAGVIILLVFVLASVLAVIPLARAYGIAVNGHYILLLTIIGALFGLAQYSLSLLVSSLASSKTLVYSLLSGLLIGMFVLYLVSQLNDKYDKLKYVSFFYYYNSTDILAHGTVTHGSYVVFGVVAVVCAVAGAMVFSRRNIPI